MTERDITVEAFGHQLEVTLLIESWGSPGNGWDDPGEGPEWSVSAAHRSDTDAPFPLTDEQREELERLIVQKHDDALEPPTYDD